MAAPLPSSARRLIHTCVVREHGAGPVDEHAPPNLPTTHLPQWDLARLSQVDYPVICNLGKRRSGKSFLNRWQIHSLRKRFAKGLIFSETKFTGFWQDYFPDALIHADYSSTLVLELLRAQQEEAARMKAGERVDNHDMFIMFDDIMGDSMHEMRSDPALSKVLTMGRHYGITVIFNVQDAFALPPSFRNNFDFVFVFLQHQKRNIQAIHENWMSLYSESIEGTRRILAENTGPCGDNGERKVVVVDNSGTQAGALYVTCAKDPGPFTLLTDEAWPDGAPPPDQRSPGSSGRIAVGKRAA